MQGDSARQYDFSREDHYFKSKGRRCAAWLYLPHGKERPPVVLMAHGFGAQRDFGLPAFAERFARRGMAVFLFDYRSFGASEGEPRNLVNPWRHLRDWRAAVSYVRGLAQVDGGRMALWGSSYSGGHVMVTAAGDGSVAAICAQVPFVDGLTSAWWTGIRHAVQATLAVIRDLLRMFTLRGSYLVPIISTPDEFGILNTPDCMEGYMAMVPADTTWRNECPARAALQLLLYRPIARARKVTCPALVLMGEKDSLIYPRAVERAASRMREATIVHLPVGHFDIYAGPWFEEVVARQGDFLARCLGA